MYMQTYIHGCTYNVRDRVSEARIRGLAPQEKKEEATWRKTLDIDSNKFGDEPMKGKEARRLI